MNGSCRLLFCLMYFYSSVALRNCQFFPGCFQCFAARKVRSVVFRLIKTDENLCRILPVRLLDGRTHYQNVLHHLFSIFLFHCEVHFILLSF